jgi:hypothetical protein
MHSTTYETRCQYRMTLREVDISESDFCGQMHVHLHVTAAAIVRQAD